MTIEPSILFMDDDLIAVDKPAGWLAHAAGTKDPDVGSWLTFAGHGHPSPVHRIDKETSGVMLFARNPLVAREYGQMLTDRELDKLYLALVYGRTRKKGVLRRPLREGRKDIPAITRYGLASWLGGFSLLRVRPETGRKHQIRRHLHGLGHPIVGDERYPMGRRVNVPAFPNRLWLHAHELTLPDGRVFTSPVPPELQATLDALEEGEARRNAARDEASAPDGVGQ